MRKILASFIVIILIVLPGYLSIPTVPLGIRYKDEIFSRVDATKDIIYGRNYNFAGRVVELKMDVYEPHGDIAEKRALIVFIHGGGFVSGNKEGGQWVEFCTTFAKRGYVTASINYRLQPQGDVDYELAITQAMHDAKAAVRSFRANSSLWRINDEKIALVGGSAGAVTSIYTTYLTELQYEGDSGNPGYSSNVSACVDLWGGLYNNVGGIDSGESPVLIIHGTEDATVPFSEAVNISNRCKEVDVYCEMHALEGEGHAPWKTAESFLPWIVDFLYGKVAGKSSSEKASILAGGGNKTSCSDGYDGPRNVYLSTRISSSLTDPQIDFVNSHFDAAMTSLLDSQVREKIQGPMLFLYRSIQGTWTDFDQFDWNHINANENMFCHNTSPENPHPNNRILTIWNSWLMDGRDIVDKNNSGSLNHWINYYAVTASEQVHGFDYDGLFIDSASHKFKSGSAYGLMPDDYSSDEWRDGRYVALEFIKSYLPDKKVVFNGLHGGNGAEHSLTLTDGGLWETFAFTPSTSKYQGKEKWTETIELAQRNRDESLIAISSKKNNLINDIQSRMFVLSSYLLVSNQNVYLTMIDLNYEEFKSIYYYPEYELELGAPLNNYTVDNNGLYRRDFEKGIALVNPSDTESLSYTLDKKYHKVIPVGGGVLQDDGTYDGFLNYEFVEDEIILPPISGVVLLNEDQISLTINIEKPKGNRLYVFNRAIMPLKNTIILGKITIQTEVYSINDMDRVEFYIDDVLKNTDNEEPYEWLWDEFAIGNHEIKVIAHDNGGNTASDNITVLRIF